MGANPSCRAIFAPLRGFDLLLPIDVLVACDSLKVNDGVRFPDGQPFSYCLVIQLEECPVLTRNVVGASPTEAAIFYYTQKQARGG